MASETPVKSDSDNQSSVPPLNKMDDRVVVVVDSGQLKSGTTRTVSETSTKPQNDLEEADSDQRQMLIEEGDDLIKVALAAEQSTEQDVVANVNNKTESHGLTKIEAAQHTIADNKNNLDGRDETSQLKGDLPLAARSGVSSFAANSAGPSSIATSSVDGKLLASSTEILQESNSADFQDAGTDRVEEERIQAKDLEVVIMSEMDGIVESDVQQDEPNIDSDVKMEGARGQDFVCEECGKAFTHISSKKRHMLKHKEGESPVVYQCLACSKTFQYNSSLKRHLKLHSAESSGKSYTCKECSKAFMYATSLKRHMKTHAGKEIYPCPHCQRCFEYISSLKRHSKLHTEGKGFKCHICSKAFGYLSSLTRHQRVHQKSLTCTKCNKEFRLYKSYVKHLEQHGEVLGEAELAAMQVEESDGGEEEIDEDRETKEADSSSCDKEGVVEELDENEVSASMVAKSMGEPNDKNQLDVIQGDVIDLQSAENHPFVKFVVSQNAVTLEQLQSFQASQAANNSDEGQGENAVAYAVVHTDENAVIGENSIVSSEIGDLSGAPVGGIVLVEFDQNNKVTERHMEGLQASNLLQLLQAVEGFAVESNAQTQQQIEPQPKEISSGTQSLEQEPGPSTDIQKAAVPMDAEKEQAEKS